MTEYSGLVSKARRILGALTFGCVSLAAVLVVGSFGAASVHATETVIPDSALISYSGNLFTSNIGSVVVTTGGGNAANVGDPSGRNDDGFSGPISLGFTINFFGTNYNSLFINNNGNVSFGSGIAAYTPQGPTGANAPIISPFFADVDTRGALSGVVHENIINNGNTFVVTWDGVGYYDSHDNLLDTFQLVINNPNHIPSGEGEIGFFYGAMQWETGDASGGTNGFGGTPAAVGFGDGNGNGEVLAGSIQNGISGIVQNHYIWFDVNGSGTPVTTNPGATPEPGTILLLGTGLLALGAGRKLFLA